LPHPLFTREKPDPIVCAELGKAIANYLDGKDRDGIGIIRALAEREASNRHFCSVREVTTSLLFTDIVDSSGMFERYGNEFGHWIVNIHDHIVEQSVAGHDGVIVKHTGDGLLAEFSSHVDSVNAALDISAAMVRHNTRYPLLPVHVRIAVNVGSVIDEGHDLYGTAVNLAARLCAKARPDQILVTNIVRQRCSDSGPECKFNELEPFLPRGFSSSIPICELVSH